MIGVPRPYTGAANAIRGVPGGGLPWVVAFGKGKLSPDGDVDVLVKGLHEAGWMVDRPKASMYIWAKIPEAYRDLGSLEFARQMLEKAKVCVSPGIGFGDHGDDHVRFALIENEARIRQAIRGIKAMFKADGLVAVPAGAAKP